MTITNRDSWWANKDFLPKKAYVGAKLCSYQGTQYTASEYTRFRNAIGIQSFTSEAYDNGVPAYVKAITPSGHRIIAGGGAQFASQFLDAVRYSSSYPNARAPGRILAYASIIYERVRADLLDFLRLGDTPSPAQSYTLFGHSLFGMIINLLAQEIKNSHQVYLNNRGTYSFGSPRTTTAGGLNVLTTEPRWAISNYDDPICMLPPDTTTNGYYVVGGGQRDLYLGGNDWYFNSNCVELSRTALSPVDTFDQMSTREALAFAATSASNSEFPAAHNLSTYQSRLFRIVEESLDAWGDPNAPTIAVSDWGQEAAGSVEPVPAPVPSADIPSRSSRNPIRRAPVVGETRARPTALVTLNARIEYVGLKAGKAIKRKPKGSGHAHKLLKQVVAKLALIRRHDDTAKSQKKVKQAQVILYSDAAFSAAEMLVLKKAEKLMRSRLPE